MKALAFSGGKDSMACLHLCRETIDFAIFVDTGKTYPETWKMVKYAEVFVPVIVVRSDREEQNRKEGIPSDVVPIDYTALGQVFTGPKAIMVQSYLQCCFENISRPLFMKAKSLGATSIIYGQRQDEGHRSPSRNGDMVDGILRLHPIENWSTKQVLDYLSTVMDVPEHYNMKYSSLDCYDCTAFSNGAKDWETFTREKYPEFYRQYQIRMDAVRNALRQSGYMEIDHGA